MTIDYVSVRFLAAIAAQEAHLSLRSSVPKLCLATLGNIWQLLATFGNFWQLLATFGNIWQHLAIFGNIWHLLATFGNF